MKYLLTLTLLLLTCSVAIASNDSTYTPGEKVAVIVINNSGEKNDNVRSGETSKTIDEINTEFSSHQFQMIDPAIVGKAVGSLDLADEENETKANLYKIGSASGADLIVFAVIQDTGQTSTTTLFDSMRGGWVSTKFWLLDVGRKTHIVDAKVSKGDSRHHAFGFGLTSGQKMQTTAAANAVRDAFTDFFTNQAPALRKQ